jgi:hypothetical protein
LDSITKIGNEVTKNTNNMKVLFEMELLINLCLYCAKDKNKNTKEINIAYSPILNPRIYIPIYVLASKNIPRKKASRRSLITVSL